MQQNIYQRGSRWFSQEYGITSIPVTGKKSIGEWRQYQRVITPDEIDAMSWDEATGLAGVCGVNDGVCIDYDHVTNEPVEIMLNYLEKAKEWLVKTPSGGHHLWLTVPGLDEFMRSGKLDMDAPEYADGSGERPHIEIRYTGHYALLPPSDHPDYPSQYRFVNGWPKVPPATVDPATLLSAYTLVTVEPEPEPVTSSVNHSPTDDRSVYVAKNCLNKLASWRCDDYENWIGVGMTLAGLGDTGLELWDQWSRQSQKYEKDCCKKAWKYLRPEGRTLKTLVKWAHDDTPSLPLAIVGMEPIDVRAMALPGDVLNAIAGYAPTWGAQRPCTDRSKADWVVIKNLIERGATDGQIATVFKENPIGRKGKYAERGDAYLTATIQKARRQFYQRIKLC